MSRTIIAIDSYDDIPSRYKNTPIADLLCYQNLGKDFQVHQKPELITVICIDNRTYLNIPNKFSFILRTPGARIIGFEFALSFPIAMANINQVALIAHTSCGMVNIASQKETFIQGIVNNAGWDKKRALINFNSFAPLYEVEDEVMFVSEEVVWLEKKYPKITFVPMLFDVENQKLSLIDS